MKTRHISGEDPPRYAAGMDVRLESQTSSSTALATSRDVVHSTQMSSLKEMCATRHLPLYGITKIPSPIIEISRRICCQESARVVMREMFVRVGVVLRTIFQRSPYTRMPFVAEAAKISPVFLLPHLKVYATYPACKEV